MDRATERKIVLVVRRTRLDDLVARFNTQAQARFYVEHLGSDFSDYQLEHEIYQRAVADAQSVLESAGRLQILERKYLPNFLFGADDTVVVLGQDGLVANTVKYATGQSIVGVNPDPKRWDGVLLPFVVADLPAVMPEVLAGRRATAQVTMARADLNTGQTLYAVNDLFIGVRSHVSARYSIQVGSTTERHSSSGVIVSTGLGSTGWFKSLMAGAFGIASAVLGHAVEHAPSDGFPWNADHLVYTVREPFPSRSSAATLVYGTVTGGQPLVVTSQMGEAGVIFSDGIENDFLEFNSGTVATIRPAERKGRLVV